MSFVFNDLGSKSVTSSGRHDKIVADAFYQISI